MPDRSPETNQVDAMEAGRAAPSGPTGRRTGRGGDSLVRAATMPRDEALAALGEAADALAREHAARRAFGNLDATSFVRRDGAVVVRPGRASGPPWAPPDHGSPDLRPNARGGPGSSGSTDPYRADVFALGMLGHRLLVGDYPPAASSRRAWRSLGRRGGRWAELSTGTRFAEVGTAIDAALQPAAQRPSNAVVFRALLVPALEALRASDGAGPEEGAESDATEAVASEFAGTARRRRIAAALSVAFVLAAAFLLLRGGDAVESAPTCRADRECGAEFVCVDGLCELPGFRYVPPGVTRVGPPMGDAPRISSRMTRGVYVQATEVTQAQWVELLGSSPAWFDGCGDTCPVESVNWYETLAFANAMSERAGLTPCYTLGRCSGTLGGGCPELADVPEGPHECAGDYVCADVEFHGLDCEGYRLPTELEWEIAARGGTSGPTYAEPAADAGDRRRARREAMDRIAVTSRSSSVDYEPAWACSRLDRRWRNAPEGLCGPAPSATREPNAFGLYDMLGNVSEWVFDAWGRLPAEEERSCRNAPIGPSGEPECLLSLPADFFADHAPGAVVAGSDAADGDRDTDRRVTRGGAWFHTWRHAVAFARAPTPATWRFVDIGFRVVRTAP